MNRKTAVGNEADFVRGSWICWKTVLGGALVSAFVYMILTALGGGIGGFTAAHIIEKGENASGLANGAGFWLGASAVISVFLGSYFATRFSDIRHKQVGASHGIVIAAVFFFFVINGTGSLVGSFAGVASNLSYQTGVSDADAAARTVGDVGWLIFVTLAVGLFTAILGGIEGVIGNLKRPFAGLIRQPSQT